MSRLTSRFSRGPSAQREDRRLEALAGPLCSCGSAFLYSIPGASSYVSTEYLLDQGHEYGASRVWDVSGKDLASLHDKDAYAVCLEWQRKLRCVGFTQKRNDPLRVGWKMKGGVGVRIKQLAQMAC